MVEVGVVGDVGSVGWLPDPPGDVESGRRGPGGWTDADPDAEIGRESSPLSVLLLPTVISCVFGT